MMVSPHKSARTNAPYSRRDCHKFGQCPCSGPTLWHQRRQRVQMEAPIQHDGSLPHTAHRLQTILTPAQEAVMVYLRKNPCCFPLDDFLAITRAFLSPDVSLWS